jgi:hypothetical protein
VSADGATPKLHVNWAVATTWMPTQQG